VNFAAFFPLLFYAAYRLPGGVAATLGTRSRTCCGSVVSSG
jgi:hypothetical protein